MSEYLIAEYDQPDPAHEALRQLEALDLPGVRVASPAAYPAVHATGSPGPWRWLAWLALSGALIGLVTAIAIEVGSSVAHPIQVGGKPVVAWIPYGVIMFELTMLGAGATSFLSLVVLAALSRRGVPRAARRAVASDRIVVIVPATKQQSAQASAVSEALAGALSVTEAP